MVYECRGSLDCRSAVAQFWPVAKAQSLNIVNNGKDVGGVSWSSAYNAPTLTVTSSVPPFVQNIQGPDGNH